MHMSKDQANQLFAELRDNLLTLQDTLDRIIEAKAWEPLGYDSLVDAWADKMVGIRLGGIIESTVVLTMYQAGAEPADVAAAVHGVGPNKADAYQQAYAAGMDAKEARSHAAGMTRRPRLGPGETYVAGYVRGEAQKRNSITMMGFEDEQIAAWKDAAEQCGMRFSDWAREVFIDAAESFVTQAQDEVA